MNGIWRERKQQSEQKDNYHISVLRTNSKNRPKKGCGKDSFPQQLFGLLKSLSPIRKVFFVFVKVMFADRMAEKSLFCMKCTEIHGYLL